MPYPERFTVGTTHRWDAWLKLASILCTVCIVPGVGWAVSVQSSLSTLQQQVVSLQAQAEADRTGVQALLSEVRELRRELAQMKTDLAQRITRVETQLEKR